MERTLKDFRPSGSTLLFALFFLLFFQTLGMWIESIYRMSLVNIAPGRELYGLLLLLIPLLLFAVSEKRERIFLQCVVAVFVTCRFLCPLVGAPLQIVLGGVGVSMFLVILAYSLSARYSFLKGNMGQGLGIAVLLSVALRSWGSSIDISVDGFPIILGGTMALLTLLLFSTVITSPTASLPSDSQPSCFRHLVMVGLFSNFTLVYFIFAAPAVVATWNGYAQLGWSGVMVTGCVVVSFTSMFFIGQRQRKSIPLATLLCNLVLVALLLLALLLWKPIFPMTVQAPAVLMAGNIPHASLLGYGMLLLSGIVSINVQHIAEFSFGVRPRNAILPVLTGMLFLLSLTLLLIASNVWGYLPYGHIFRNQFYLPFLVAGIGILLPWMILKPAASKIKEIEDHFLRRTVIILAMFALAGALVHFPRVRPSEPGTELIVMTYNMQLGSHEDGNRNYRQQRDLLRQINPDVIGLQESDAARPSGGNIDAVRYFAQSLGYYAYYGPGSISGTFGAAILSRYPISNPRMFFTYSDTDEVGTAVADIDVNGTVISFFSSHPAGSADAMNAHVTALIEEAQKHRHVIAVGDYNFTSRSSHYAKLSQVLLNSAESPDVLTSGSRHEIDHIFISSDFDVLESCYLQPPDSQTDHPAHWSVLQMK